MAHSGVESAIRAPDFATLRPGCKKLQGPCAGSHRGAVDQVHRQRGIGLDDELRADDRLHLVCWIEKQKSEASAGCTGVQLGSFTRVSLLTSNFATTERDAGAAARVVDAGKNNSEEVLKPILRPLARSRVEIGTVIAHDQCACML